MAQENADRVGAFSASSFQVEVKFLSGEVLSSVATWWGCYLVWHAVDSSRNDSCGLIVIDEAGSEATTAACPLEFHLHSIT